MEDALISSADQKLALSERHGAWSFDEKFDCWRLEGALYTQKSTAPCFQRLSVYAPATYVNADGTVNEAGQCGRYTARSAPVVFENNAAGYMQMPPARLGGPRCYAEPYLRHGLVYVTCGCRGRETRDDGGRAVGKSPATLVDLKTAIRFLRHNAGALPGNLDKIVSVGWSAGGAMSALLAVTGDNDAFTSYLEENGAYMEESDAVYAAQIYCPIIDLEHADLAYEWMFAADKVCEDSPAGPSETMTPFKEALSDALRTRYVSYVNSLNLRAPKTGEALTLGSDGRSGSFYAYFMDCLGDAATDFFVRLTCGRLAVNGSPEDYLCGRFQTEVPAKSGADKRDWLRWDGQRAQVTDLDTYVRRHRRRMKPCTAFDKLTMDSGENQVFGRTEEDFMHFSADVAGALDDVRARFPAEYARYYGAFQAARDDAALKERVALINPLNYIGAGMQSRRAGHYRIRVGASDADTSLSVSLVLALKLANAGYGSVDYAMVWDQPHCEADYPGEILSWIDRVSR